VFPLADASFSSNFTMKRSGVSNQGAYMAWYIMTYSFANTLAPLVGTQVIARFGFSALWTILVLLAALSFAGFRMLAVREHAVSA
jgi:MFS family permease